jgi:hypothetical protein
VGDAELYGVLDIPLPPSEAELKAAGEEGRPVPSLRPRQIVSDIPYPLSRYTGFMLDDHRILAFRVSCATACSHLSLLIRPLQTDGDGLTSFDVLCFV